MFLSCRFAQTAHILLRLLVTVSLGINDGDSLGINDGESLGINDGESLGINDGKSLGINDGELLGINDGDSLVPVNSYAFFLSVKVVVRGCFCSM